MPGKKTSRTRKPATRAAARKAPAARKTVKSAPRKAKPAAVRARAAKPGKSSPRSSTRAAATSKAPVKAAKSHKPDSAVRAPIIVKSKSAGPAPTAPDPRPVLASIAPRVTRRPMFNTDDDDDGGGNHSLLLGPRNVRPYRERKGEEYMGRDQLEHFRLILSNWKRDLMEEVDRTMTHMKDEAANPPDPNDRATLESEFALELRTRDRERKLIRKIEEALSRIGDGSYGYCVETGEPIGVKRLEARPVATLCIEAQERRERREKQYGDRDDWYR
jgi:DnaK suppressor protein